MTKTKFEVTKFVEYFRENGFEFTHQDQAATETLRQTWREAIGPTPRQATAPKGDAKIRQFDWEIFSGGDAVYLQGDDAISALRRHARGDFYIWPQIERAGSIAFRDQLIPDIAVLERARELRGGFLCDLYLSSTDMNWTFVLTHEREWGIGPYYAEKAWQQKYKPGQLSLAALRRRG